MISLVTVLIAVGVEAILIDLSFGWQLLWQSIIGLNRCSSHFVTVLALDQT